ncbi:FHA domain-containing protein [Actinacidiphila yanglinensis]|uniref:FHA domain-containing protein n=2 Tax=Actinacidiphila yanglinensis TaxID=310779 RepID=A0A1H5WZI8_9ACTN|nr:FHA domain-containing protein [Actinacidiphila yanglinensis]
MGGESGGGRCPECGTTGAHPGQLVCQGCYLPFALMAATLGSDAGTADTDTTDMGPANPGSKVSPSDPTREHTRVLGRLTSSASGSAKTRRDTPPRAVRLRFPGDQVVAVEPGRHIRLGREPRLCPAVAFLAAHDNLSRLHATVTVEADGSASITDEGSMNGTFLHGYRLPPHEPATLHPGDAIRLAANVTVRVLP